MEGHERDSSANLQKPQGNREKGKQQGQGLTDAQEIFGESLASVEETGKGKKSIPCAGAA